MDYIQKSTIGTTNSLPNSQTLNRKYKGDYSLQKQMLRDSL